MRNRYLVWGSAFSTLGWCRLVGPRRAGPCRGLGSSGGLGFKVNAEAFCEWGREQVLW